jgi:hypothetical protein
MDIPADLLGPGKSLMLDLGEVRNLAGVKVNGVDLGVLWTAPFRTEITSAVRAGTNTLQIQVTNLLINRLIGDEQLPSDCDHNGPLVTSWPQWLVDDDPDPTGRHTFTTWLHWQKDSPLIESGLIGPVFLRSGVDCSK